MKQLKIKLTENQAVTMYVIVNVLRG